MAMWMFVSIHPEFEKMFQLTTTNAVMIEENHYIQ